QADTRVLYSTLLETQRSAFRIVLGLALLVVPVIALVLAYLLPTIRTFQLSRTEGLGVFASTETVGNGNYDQAFADGRFVDSLLQLAGPTALMVLTGAVLAPLAAWCLHRAGRRIRTTATVVWTLAAISLAPVALTVSWLIDRLVSESGRTASIYDWPGLIAGVVLGTCVVACLAALRGATRPRRFAAVLVTAGLAAFALTAAGLQTFAYSSVSGLPADLATPLVQIYEGIHSGWEPGTAAAKSMLLMAILVPLGLGAAALFAAARTRIDVIPGPADPAPARPLAVLAGLAALLVLLAAVGFFLLPWITRIGDGTVEGGNLWFIIRRTWGPPLVTTLIALPAAALGGYAIGALRPLGDASHWLLLLFAPWLFIGSGPLGAANLEAVAGEGEYVVVGSFPPRAWIAIPLLFVFAALFRGLENRRREALALGTTPGSARLAFLNAAWPMLVLMGLVLLLVHVQDLFWQQLTLQDMLSAGPMTWALKNLEFEHSGVALGFPGPILAVYALAATAAAIWYLPRLAVKVGRD
ncbi:MAG TPA: hypothetical protein VHG10_05425, partial [Glycomyces sp.]|nr:hypothetical protein [Glycomyces sp.]